MITYMGGQRLETPWGTGSPVFDGGGVNGARGVSFPVARSHITLDGIKVVNVGYAVDGSGTGLFILGGSDIEVKNCFLDTNAVNAIYYEGVASGCDRFYFHHNTVRNSGRLHIYTSDYHCDDMQLYNNNLEGIGTYSSPTYHSDGFMIGGDGTSDYRITNLKIFNNKFYGDWSSGATAAIYLNGTGNDSNALYSTKNVFIFNNIIAYENNTCSTTPFSPGAITVYNGRHSNVNIYNNTISGDACTTNPMTGIFLAKVDSAIIKNNILSGVDNAILIGGNATGTFIVDSNLFYTVYGSHLIYDQRPGRNRYDTCAAAQAAGFGTTYCSNSDPKFVMVPRGGVTGTGNWSIQAISPAKGNGANLGAPYNSDIRGMPRPQGSAWAIGAFEYRSSSIGAPANFRQMTPN